MNKLSYIPEIQKRLSRARTVDEAKAIRDQEFSSFSSHLNPTNGAVDLNSLTRSRSRVMGSYPNQHVTSQNAVSG